MKIKISSVVTGEVYLQDWAQNLKLKFSTDTSSSYFQELYAGSKVYEGELNMFRAVTDQSLVGAQKHVLAVSANMIMSCKIILILQWFSSCFLCSPAQPTCYQLNKIGINLPSLVKILGKLTSNNWHMRLRRHMQGFTVREAL